jgi:predicted flavoprotein YhiN
VAVTFVNASGEKEWRKGQFVITSTGIEGSLVYAISAPVRDQLAANGSATIWLDLLPDLDAQRVLAEVTRARGARSMSSHLQSRLGIKGVKAALLRECLGAGEYADPAQQRRRGALRSARRRLDAARRAGRVRGRRDDRLGSADRRLPLERVLCQRPCGRARRARLA